MSYQRPVARCRTFNSSIVEKTVDQVSKKIADVDLRRLFINTYPNTLDTAIKWRGYANNDSSTGEELTFIITGKLLLSTLGEQAADRLRRHQCNVAA